MGLDIDIRSAPPNTATIAAARAGLAAERLRLRELNKRFMIVAVSIVAAIIAYVLFVAMPIVSKPGAEGSIVFIIVYTIPYLLFFVFVVGNTRHRDQVEVPRKALETAEQSLQEAAQEDIAALIDPCRVHAPLSAYQSQVESQGRALFKGELEAMRRWLEEHTGK